jgi:predicted aspartyl protease
MNLKIPALALVFPLLVNSSSVAKPVLLQQPGGPAATSTSGLPFSGKLTFQGSLQIEVTRRCGGLTQQRSYALQAGQPQTLHLQNGEIVRVYEHVPAADTETIPFRYAPTGIAMCKPRINGKEVGWFLFDTGATHHVLDRQKAQDLELEATGNSTVKTPAGNSSARRIVAQELTLGPALWEQQEFVELDLRPLQALVGKDVVGVLGYESFAAWILEFDYRQERITLHRPEHFVKGELNWIPLQVKDREICLQAQVEGHPVWLQIDTGSNGTVAIYTPTVRRLGLLDGRETWQSSDLGIDGRVSSLKAKLESLEIAGNTWNDTTATLCIADSGTHSATFPDGILGCRILESFTLYLDCGSRQAAFDPGLR